MTITRHTDLTLKYLLNVPSGLDDGAEAPLVVVMHGRGADAQDLADIAPMIDAGGYRFVFPDAPRKFEPYPGMAFGFSWFDGWPPQGTSFGESRKRLLEFLDQIVGRYRTPAGKVALCGFSQGGMMALDAGFRTTREIAAIVCMSGALHEADLPPLREKKERPVLIVHGSGDDVIPVIAARRARAVLEEHEIAVEYEEFPMGHHVTPDSLARVRDFLQKHLA